jgi:endoglucanase
MRITRLLLIIIVCCLSTAAAPTTAIKVDQVGYLPEAPKLALVVANQPATEFLLRKGNDSTIVFRGRLSAPVKDADSGDQVRLADFSEFRHEGRYYIDVPGIGRSWSFAIGPSVYRQAFYLTMRSFYGQRCGTAVDLGSEFPKFKHAACHLNGAYHASSGKSGPRESTKGWHDAGDYGRYVVNSGISTGELLWTYEVFEKRVRSISLNIPESKDRTPDILDEVRWNLDWMLTMQDEDGGVWHKQTSERFAEFVMPEKDLLVSYVIGAGKEPYKSSTATADFAAVLAIAARVYKPFDPAYARKCLAAAEKAWVWLQKYPNITFRNTDGIETGGYGDNDPRDEILWAAGELWRTTKEEKYEQYFLARYSEQLPAIAAGPPGWPRVAPLALWTYALDHTANKEAASLIHQSTLKSADEIVERTNKHAYRHSLRSRDYVWGSNGVVANYGVQLLIANIIKPDVRYREAALENLHYILGRNTFSLSWVTQLGENPFRHPHHRPSQADNNSEPWPGLLSGGPNRSKQDPSMRKLADLPPAKMYLDDWESYAANETAINWNAPLVFLLAAFLDAD